MRCLSVLDLVILFYLFIFFLGREGSKGPRMGRQFFKNVDFSVTYLLKWL